ncbi:ankyrin repeat-containing domain protein [Mycena crocata]|nr:ankyrin repeat-containing domain protein [Mycena crocata]
MSLGTIFGMLGKVAKEDFLKSGKSSEIFNALEMRKEAESTGPSKHPRVLYLSRQTPLLQSALDGPPRHRRSVLVSPLFQSRRRTCTSRAAVDGLLPLLLWVGRGARGLGLAIGSLDPTVRVWDLDTVSPQISMQGWINPASDVADGAGTYSGPGTFPASAPGQLPPGLARRRRREVTMTTYMTRQPEAALADAGLGHERNAVHAVAVPPQATHQQPPGACAWGRNGDGGDTAVGVGAGEVWWMAGDVDRATPVIISAWHGGHGCGAAMDVIPRPIFERCLCHREGTQRLKLPLEKGADVNVRDIEDESPLHAASWGWHTEIVRLLLEKGACVDARSIEDESPLHAQGKRLGISCLRKVLKSMDRTRETEAHYSSRHGGWRGLTKIVILLLENGADANMCDAYQGTALQAAAQWGHRETLLDSFITAQTPMHAPKDTQGQTEIVSLLLANGASVDVLGGEYYKRDTECLGAEEDSEELVHESVLEAACSVSHRRREGCTEIVRLLLKNGADVKIHGGRALQAVSSRGYVDVVRLLLEHGANVNASALEGASSGGHAEIVRWLEEKGGVANGEASQ